MHKRSIVLSLALGLFLFGCESTSEKMAEKGVAPMTADEIRAMAVDNSFHQTGNGWEWAGYFRPDGTKVGKAWWNGGEKTGIGTWDIKDDGQFCGQWDNEWGGGGYGCYRYFKDGDDVVYDHVSGSKGEYPTGTLTPVAGNPYNL